MWRSSEHASRKRIPSHDEQFRQVESVVGVPVDIALLSIQYSVFSIVVENVIHIDVSRPLNWKKPGEHSFLP